MERLCCVCPQLRQGDPRVYARPTVCEGCRLRLRSILGEVVDLYAELHPSPINAGEPWWDERGHGHYDPIAADLPAGALIKSDGLHVSGSRSPPLPVSIDTLDLALTVPAILDSWARDWQGYAWAWLPDPTVPLLSAWLTERLEWACDHHPAVDDFADELSDLTRRMRPRAPQAELKTGVPCRECERLTLFVWPGGDYVECGSCPALLTPLEYGRWVSLISSKEHQPWVREVVARTRADAPASGS
jgi:hypothetical protein